MSPKPEDFIDPEFWDWYRDVGPKWLLRHRLDIINAMYDAYESYLDTENMESPVVMRPGSPFMFLGTPEEMQEFTSVLNNILSGIPGLPPKSKNKSKFKPISNTDIARTREALNKFKLRRNKDENNKS